MIIYIFFQFQHENLFYNYYLMMLFIWKIIGEDDGLYLSFLSSYDAVF